MQLKPLHYPFNLLTQGLSVVASLISVAVLALLATISA